MSKSSARKSSPVTVTSLVNGEVANVVVKGRAPKVKPAPAVIESSIPAPAPAPAETPKSEKAESPASKPASKAADPFGNLSSNKGLLKALWSTRGDICLESKGLMVPVSKAFVISTLQAAIAADVNSKAIWAFAFRKPDGAGGAPLHGAILS